MKHKILVVDDDENACLLARKALEKEGFEVFFQTEVSGIIGCIKDYTPDLLLLDVTMPKLSGDSLAMILKTEKSIKKKPKIVLYSNKSGKELEYLKTLTDAENFVEKSGGPSALVATVRKTLEV